MLSARLPHCPCRAGSYLRAVLPGGSPSFIDGMLQRVRNSRGRLCSECDIRKCEFDFEEPSKLVNLETAAKGM